MLWKRVRSYFRMDQQGDRKGPPHLSPPPSPLPSAKSRDLLGNGDAGGFASCRGAGNPVWGTGNWGPALSPFPKRLGDDAPGTASLVASCSESCHMVYSFQLKRLV